MFQRLRPGKTIVWPSVAALMLAALACAGSGVERRVFVERLGDDTTAVEEIVRSADEIEGTLVVRSPITRVARYSATLAPQGRVSSFVLEWSTPEENPDGPPRERYEVALGGDTANVVTETVKGTDTTSFELSADAIPTTRRLPFSVVVWELALRRAMTAGADEYEVALLSPGVPRSALTLLRRLPGDSVSMRVIGGFLRAKVDEGGRVLGIDGRGSTMGVVVEPAEDLDLAALASTYAARDARGEGLGNPSPPAVVTTQVAGAELEVNYSRPARRGRRIWGDLVPWNQVWRTGANAATQLTTSRDIRLGDARIPAGTYTLWTTFTPEGATFIINSQTGQWGTQYDATRDLARVPMSTERLSEDVEIFTIAIEPDGDEADALLTLAWDRTRYAVPITVIR